MRLFPRCVDCGKQWHPFVTGFCPYWNSDKYHNIIRHHWTRGRLAAETGERD